MKEVIKSKKTKLILLSIIGILVCATGLVTLAMLLSRTNQLTNTFELGNVTTEIEENFEKTDVATTFKKEPVVKNIGENDCYVRVRVTVSPEGQLNILGWDTENWTEKDGYYYYKHVLKGDPDGDGTKEGDSTTALFTTVAVKDEYKDTIDGFEVTVYQEAVQSKMNARDGSSTSDAMTIWEAYEANAIPDSFKLDEIYN